MKEWENGRGKESRKKKFFLASNTRNMFHFLTPQRKSFRKTHTYTHIMHEGEVRTRQKMEVPIVLSVIHRVLYLSVQKNVEWDYNHQTERLDVYSHRTFFFHPLPSTFFLCVSTCVCMLVCMCAYCVVARLHTFMSNGVWYSHFMNT